eukprot:6263254-Pyramimonas_sp.AAC.1
MDPPGPFRNHARLYNTAQCNATQRSSTTQYNATRCLTMSQSSWAKASSSIWRCVNLRPTKRCCADWRRTSNASLD